MDALHVLYWSVSAALWVWIVGTVIILFRLYFLIMHLDHVLIKTPKRIKDWFIDMLIDLLQRR